MDSLKTQNCSLYLFEQGWSLFITETTAYQQLLNTTGSSFSLTALSTGELESDDDIEKDVLPKRPGPTSSPRQTAAAAAAAPKDSREIPKQSVTSSPSVNIPSDSARNAHNKEGFVSISCVAFLFFLVHWFSVLFYVMYFINVHRVQELSVRQISLTSLWTRLSSVQNSDTVSQKL